MEPDDQPVTFPHLSFGSPGVPAIVPRDMPFDIPTEPDVEKAFAAPQAAVFDLELPWTNDCGVIKNKYGIRIAKFENWEQADAVVATMNGSQQLMEAVAQINAVGDAPVSTQETTRIQLSDENPSGLSDAEVNKIMATINPPPGTEIMFNGIRVVADPNLPAGTFVATEPNSVRVIQ